MIAQPICLGGLVFEERYCPRFRRALITPPPVMSNINFIPGRDIPNMVIVQIPPGRTIDFYTAYAGTGRTDLKVDLIGYIGEP